MLHLLNPDPNTFVDVQQTEFSHDVLGRWACGTWDEVSNNGGDPFDVIVVGAGMYGGDNAHQNYRRAGNNRLRARVGGAGALVLSPPTQEHPRPALCAPPATGGAPRNQQP